MDYSYIVIGAGLSGASVARLLAEKTNKKVLVQERREHIGGSVFDCEDENGVLIHKYGPHIFHTEKTPVFEFLSRFTEWFPYQHKVMANVHGLLFPVPFNLNSIDIVFDKDKAEAISKKLIEVYGEGASVSVLTLRESGIPELKELSDYVYENVFLHYTQKQWGLAPEQIDPNTIKRVPVSVSRDDRYFHSKHQGMPKDGYTAMISRMLQHENIDVATSTDSYKTLAFTNGEVFFNGKKTDAKIICTGAIDELFGYCCGRLPYRTVEFAHQSLLQDNYQPCGTVNYTVDEEFTRITEFKHLTNQKIKDKTAILREYPREYRGKEGETPYYVVASEQSAALYAKYKNIAASYESLFLLGRLAEYRYYDMDAVVDNAMTLSTKISE